MIAFYAVFAFLLAALTFETPWGGFFTIQAKGDAYAPHPVPLPLRMRRGEGKSHAAQVLSRSKHPGEGFRVRDNHLEATAVAFAA